MLFQIYETKQKTDEEKIKIPEKNTMKLREKSKQKRKWGVD